jgi:hypothetical protein
MQMNDTIQDDSLFKDLQIEYLSVNELREYEGNARTHSDKQINQIVESIKEFGFTNPILKQGLSIIAGHGRLAAAKRLGLAKVPTIELSHLTRAQAKALVIADNQLALNAGWDEDILKAEIEGLQSLDFNIDLLGFEQSYVDALFDESEDEGGYTRKIETPDYTPSEIVPEISELFDRSKTDSLLAEIDASDFDESVKGFLRIAAERHTVFNFSKIADFYSHADANVQELMENSALVIIDFDKAIANGFVKLSKSIADQYERDLDDDAE